MQSDTVERSFFVRAGAFDGACAAGVAGASVSAGTAVSSGRSGASVGAGVSVGASAAGAGGMGVRRRRRGDGGGNRLRLRALGEGLDLLKHLQVSRRFGGLLQGEEGCQAAGGLNELVPLQHVVAQKGFQPGHKAAVPHRFGGQLGEPGQHPVFRQGSMGGFFSEEQQQRPQPSEEDQRAV